jgi:outer membrane protein assembly factor BamA
MWKKHLWLVATAMLYGATSFAQTNFIIGEIVISGNKRTKNYVIERELPFKAGDTVALPVLVEQFETARQQLINTRLFNEAVVSLKSVRGRFVDISIELKERWYIFPIPYVRPIDRNLSEWAKQGYGTDRLNYGFKFTHYNFSGRNDKLRLWLITGYSKQIQFQYDQPYADKTLKHGYKVSFGYSENKEMNYGTSNNQQLFTDTLAGVKSWLGSVEYNYRPALRTFHSVKLGFTHFSIDQNVLNLNHKYYDDSVNNLNIPEISYTLRHYNLDYIPFPLKGWSGEASILKKGIYKYSNMWQLSAKYQRALGLGKKFYFNLQSQGLIRYPFNQPFYNSQLFGYGDMYLRGMEKYVVDGVGGFMSRQTFRKEILKFNLPTFISSKSHDKIPFRVYAKAFTDVGYAFNKRFPENSLTNRMLYTTGAGIDIVTFYDFVFRFDYSFNQLGQNGLFLHFKNEF